MTEDQANYSVDQVESSHATDSSPSPESQTQAEPNPDLSAVRDLVLKAHPDVVPDMIQGDSLDALMASVEPARAAYQQIASRFSTSNEGSPDSGNPVTGNAEPSATTPPSSPREQPPAPVASQPGGERQTYVVNVEELSPSAKIAEGLRRRRD